MTTPREIELKFDLDSAALQAVRDHCLRSDAYDEMIHERLTSIYFDTKRLSLRRRGLTLRIRHDGKRRIQTIKSEQDNGGGLFDRLEWSVEIEGEGPDLDKLDEFPFRARLDPGRLRSRLRPVFTTKVERTLWRVRSTGTEVEVALDAGEVTAGTNRVGVVELELELKHGVRAELFEIARSIVPANALKLGVLAKSERGYALLSAKPPASVKADAVCLNPDASTGDAFQGIVRGCIRHFRLNESLLLETRGPEPLHQCRVALRRLRTAFSLFKDIIADEEVENLKRRVRLLARKLGEARDLDVFVSRLKERHEGGAEMPSENEEALKQASKDREHAYDRVIAALRGKRFQTLMFDVLAWSETGPWLSTADRAAEAECRRPIASFAAEVLEYRTRKVKKRGKGLQELDAPARHDVRIETKKLRYASEFFASLASSKKHRRRHEAFYTALVALQDRLGDLNDFATGDNLARNTSRRPGRVSRTGSKPGRVADAPFKRSRAEKASLRAAASAFREIAKAKPFWERGASEPKH